MKTKKLKIEGEDKLYFLVQIELNRVYVQIVEKGYENRILFNVPYYIQRDEKDFSKNPKELEYLHIEKKDFDLPKILHGCYQEFLELRKLEEEIFTPISGDDMKIIEFGITQEGEEDYLP